MLIKIKIFNSRFVNEIKNIKTHTIFEKFKLIVQTYNDRDKNFDANINHLTNKSMININVCSNHQFKFMFTKYFTNLHLFNNNSKSKILYQIINRTRIKKTRYYKY